jgi:ubiquinone/menaquinone biosynthesis C-methylase UbiE
LPYWNQQFADTLEIWGEGNAWNEIQFLISGCSGKVLDIACGTGKVIELLNKYPQIDIYGCDISNFLIQKAIQRGIPENRLKICDATKMNYSTNFFDFSYSIGSLEHFSQEGIEKCISECYRITKKTSFHMVPVSRSGSDEGWMTTVQSFYNNSTDWWKSKYLQCYDDVIVLDSTWQDDFSYGKWFINFK